MPKKPYFELSGACMDGITSVEWHKYTHDNKCRNYTQGPCGTEPAK